MTVNAKSVRALDGVKILAFEQVLSGPFATCLLADMGAEVIKVERPGVGDVIRSLGFGRRKDFLPVMSGSIATSAASRSMSRKKKAEPILQELAKRSDIFFENYAPGRGRSVRPWLRETERAQSAADLLLSFRLWPGRSVPRRQSLRSPDSRRRRHHRHHRLSR